MGMQAEGINSNRSTKISNIHARCGTFLFHSFSYSFYITGSYLLSYRQQHDHLIVDVVVDVEFILIPSHRAIDTVYQIWLAYFYLTLAMRESILVVNGSNINSWWITHHYLSILLVVTLVTWPDTLLYQQFRPQFFIYSFYSSIVQLLQYRYQIQRLYVMKSLGKANQMDVANSDSTQVVFGRGFIYLLPFVFLGQFMQFYNAITLTYWAISATEWQEWQAYTIGLEFFILAYGNLQTTVSIILHKYRKWKAIRAAKKD